MISSTVTTPFNPITPITLPLTRAAQSPTIPEGTVCAIISLQQRKPHENQTAQGYLPSKGETKRWTRSQKSARKTSVLWSRVDNPGTVGPRNFALDISFKQKVNFCTEIKVNPRKRRRLKRKTKARIALNCHWTITRFITWIIAWFIFICLTTTTTCLIVISK